MKHVLLGSARLVKSSSPADGSQAVGTAWRYRLLLALGLSSALMISGCAYLNPYVEAYPKNVPLLTGSTLPRTGEAMNLIDGWAQAVVLVMIFVTTVGSVMFLWKKNFQYDALAVAVTEVGLAFLAVNLVTGSIQHSTITGNSGRSCCT
jgi:hypothetical protein